MNTFTHYTPYSSGTETFDIDYNSYNPYSNQPQHIDTNGTYYRKVHENKVFTFNKIENYIEFKENYNQLHIYDSTETVNPYLSSLFSMYVSTCNKELTETRKEIQYIDIKEPAEFQFVYMNINKEPGNRRAAIRHHIMQYKKKRGPYKHISKNMLKKLNIDDKVINNYKI